MALQRPRRAFVFGLGFVKAFSAFSATARSRSNSLRYASVNCTRIASFSRDGQGPGTVRSAAASGYFSAEYIHTHLAGISCSKRSRQSYSWPRLLKECPTFMVDIRVTVRVPVWVVVAVLYMLF